MDWYIVIKTIKGRRYRYRQRTWREGSKVKTESYSLGPADGPADQRSVKRSQALTPLVRDTVEQLSDPAQAIETEGDAWDTRDRPFQPVPVFEKLREACVGAVRWAVPMYVPQHDSIGMPFGSNFIDLPGYPGQARYYSVLLHELTHWTMRAGRCDRILDLMTLHEEEVYAREELVAEATAVAVMTALGHPPPSLGVHADYFQFHLAHAGSREEALNYAREQSERAAVFLLSRVNTTKAV